MAGSLFSPDDAQTRVLDHSRGALLVIGGAGTGKTAVLRERFARLIEAGAEPERVALVVGSRRARDDARATLLARLHVSLPGLRVLTFHGLALALLKEREGEPPEVLSAPEQFAKVRELLLAQDVRAWPAYGGLLGLRGFADEVRQLLSRMQESLRTPEELSDAAAAAGLGGWEELARFAAEYLGVLDAANQVDFAGLLQRAALAAAEEGPPLFDHILVDDYQDTTLAAEAILRGLVAPDLVVAADQDAHVFSFQGTTRLPLDRFATEAFPGAERIRLTTRHRSVSEPSVEAWIAPHTSEEHAAVARELRRLHVEEGVAWSDLAVVVRRQGAHVGNLLRALDDAQVPRVVPERGLSLGTAPSTHPYVLALRWLVADPPAREELIEPMLTSDVVGLSPAAARGLIRRARVEGRSAGEALEVIDGLDPAEADAVVAARETLAKASLFAGMSVQDAFRVLWEDLPCSARLVEAAGADTERRRDLDAVVTFSNAVSEASEGGDSGVQAFLEALDAGEHGPGWTAWDHAGPDAVAVLTAHGTAGLEFDTVVVAGTVEGNFPSLSRPEPMFDLALLERPRSQSDRNRERLEDERRLFDVVSTRARRRLVLTASDPHGEEPVASARSRFVAERGIAWQPVPGVSDRQPLSRAEAVPLWRR